MPYSPTIRERALKVGLLGCCLASLTARSGLAQTRNADPVSSLVALERALATDNAAAFTALVHPTYGLTLWHTPGAGVASLGTITPHPRVRPSQALRFPPGSSYWTSVRTSLRHSLAHLDRNPVDPTAAIYGHCDESIQTAFRAYLQSPVDDAFLQATELQGDGSVDPSKVHSNLVLLHSFGFSAYLALVQGSWRVVHLLVSDPCSV